MNPFTVYINYRIINLRGSTGCISSGSLDSSSIDVGPLSFINRVLLTCHLVEKDDHVVFYTF